MARRGASPPPERNTPKLNVPQLSGRTLSKHSRDNRPQNLRAVRPFTQTVSSQKSLHKDRKIDQIAWGDGTCADPLPLLASEMNLRQPPSSTPAAIEWLLLRAQGLSAVLDELDFAWSYSRKRTAPPRSPAAYLSAFERELRREALYAEIQQLETMLRPQCILPSREQQQAGAADEVYPRCNWPRQGSILRSTPAPVETAAIALAMLAVTEAAPPAAFARCQWPRAVAAAVAGARCEWPRKASAAPAFASRAESPALAARCAWPRTSPAASSGPRCAWPRPTALSALPGLSPAPTVATIGAHCAWPHKSSSAAAEAPRCLWPRATSPPLAGASTPGARCNWPRAASAVASAETAPVERARCAWPRQVANPDVQALLERALVQAEATAPQAVEGPRCAWPRAGAAPAPSPAVAEGPRCAWPCGVPATPAPTPVEIPLGPRCAWPRQTEAIQRSAAAEELHGDMLPQIAREEAKLEAAGRVFERRRVRAITLGA
ncbi:unnamed protein product [Closterium sp. Yama58-4]|nr:unnamed protein product [Closterium sp. Yama58-4]